MGGIILTASHNPGGESGDFGIKFNTKNGGPALEDLTDSIYTKSKSISSYKTAELSTEAININLEGEQVFGKIGEYPHDFKIEVISQTQIYVDLMKIIFDFAMIEGLVRRDDFKMIFDGLSGVAGPYAIAVFNGLLGVPVKYMHFCEAMLDFNGGHPDPNLTYAEHLVRIMAPDLEKEPELFEGSKGFFFFFYAFFSHA